MTSPETFEIFAIRYHRMLRKGSECMIFCPPDLADKEFAIDYAMWVIRNDQRTYVIDTGYTPAQARALGREFDCDPMNVLRDLGVVPGDVSELILTHLHYDHAGNVDQFPNAKIYLHEAELPCATGWMPSEAAFGFAYHRDHIKSVVDAVFDRRVRFVRKAFTEVTPGLELHHIPGHSPGHLSLRVHTRRGWIMMAIDASHFFENFELRRPFPILMSLEQTMQGYDRLAELQPDTSLILPGHDGRLAQMFPAAAPDLKGKVIQLDADPVRSRDTF